ncbi:MAG: hypothetical protein KDD39_12685, partial [Bdellovibrionales bacterium]|nr:hypothetical protein [Bdellovibrionales bacterium]
MRKLIGKIVVLGLLVLGPMGLCTDALVLVNGKELPKASLDGFAVYRLSWKEVNAYVTENDLLKTPAFRKAYELAESHTGEAFYFIYGQADGKFWVRLYLTGTTYRISATGAVQNEEANAKPMENVPPVAVPKPVADSAPAEPVQYKRTHLWAVGRELTEAERATYKQVYATDYATFISHKESNAVVQEQLRAVQQDVQGRNLSGRTFTIAWATDSEGLGIKGSAQINVDPIPEPPKDPELEFEAPEIASLQDLEAVAAENAPAEDMLPRFFRWAITAESFDCRSSDGSFEFDGESSLRPIFYKLNITQNGDLNSEASQAAQKTVATWLTRPERIRLFERTSETTHCLHPVFKNLWAHTVKSRPQFLVWDLYSLMQTVYANRGNLEYSADHYYQTEDEELKADLKLVQSLIFSLPASQFDANLAQNAKDWLTRDTNSEAEESRKEPIDILKWTLGPEKLTAIAEDTDLGSVGPGTIASYTLQHLLNPQKYPAKIVLAVSSDSHMEKFKEKHFFIFCAGGQLQADPQLQENLAKVGDWISYLDLTEAQLREFRDRRHEPTFSCEKESAKIGLPVERLKVPLKAPVSEHFLVGSDKTVKAVFTFSLVDQVSNDFVTNMKRGISLQGYEVKSEAVIRNPKTEFLEEALTADFYFPTNHATDDSKFWIGSTGGRKFVLEKKRGDVLLQLVIFMPPASGGSHESVTDEEISAFFRKRRKISDQRRLTVMNVKCGSASCVPKW